METERGVVCQLPRGITVLNSPSVFTTEGTEATEEERSAVGERQR